MLLVVADEGLGGGVLGGEDVVVAGQRRRDLDGELLAELDPHWSKLSMPQTTPWVNVMCS